MEEEEQQSSSDSKSLFEKILKLRQNEGRQKNNPWFRSIPVAQVVFSMYKSLSTTLETSQLVGLGNILLSLLAKEVSLTHGRTSVPPLMPGWTQYLNVLEQIITRVTSGYSDNSQAQYSEETKRFMDRVWELYTNGLLDLNKTVIPLLITKASPSHLEEALLGCFHKGDDDEAVVISSPSPLIPLCDHQPENYLTAVDFLKSRYLDYAHDVGMRKRILKFGSDFQTQLREKMGDTFATVFPSHIQPLIYFLNHLSSLHSKSMLYRKDQVANEILCLVDNIFHICDNTHFDPTIVIFLLLTLPDLKSFNLFKRKSYRNVLWFKVAMSKTKCDDFLIL